MATTVAQMTPEELSRMIESIVESAIDRKFAELSGEWDDDGEMRPEVRQQLIRQLKAVANGERGIPFQQVQEQLGLN